MVYKSGVVINFIGNLMNRNKLNSEVVLEEIFLQFNEIYVK